LTNEQKMKLLVALDSMSDLDRILDETDGLQSVAKAIEEEIGEVEEPVIDYQVSRLTGLSFQLHDIAVALSCQMKTLRSELEK